MVRVASLDPGTKSGVVFWEGERRVWAGADVRDGLWAAYEVSEDDWLASSEVIWNLVEDQRIDVLLYENFVLRGGGGHSSEASALDSVRVTSGVLAMLRFSLWGGEIVPFGTGIKSVMSDERMKRWGLWLQGKGAVIGGLGGDVSLAGFEGHATDAARGLVWFARQGFDVG